MSWIELSLRENYSLSNNFTFEIQFIINNIEEREINGNFDVGIGLKKIIPS